MNQPYFSTIFFLCISVGLISCSKEPLTTKKDADFMQQKVDSLLSIMTLEEKIGQMNQYSGFMDFTGPRPKEGQQALKLEHLKKGWVGSMLNVHGVENVRAVQKIAVEETRLGIPLIIGFDVIHGYKTISPIPLAEAASWDLEAIQRSAEIAAKEASAAGIHWTFAPMVDISRDARWGRVMEGAGEDPYLGSLIAKARVRGFQGEDLSSPHTIAATAKHFAGYGFAEAGREYNTVDVGTYTLHNVINPPFKAAIEADVKTFMNAFNILNGIPATGNEYLQRDLLKGEWNFQGFVVSDWGSITELIDHGFAKDGREAAKKAINAGSDMDMESYHYIHELADLVRSGEVSEDLVDDAARRILRLKFELGLFEDPYHYTDEEREKKWVNHPSFLPEIKALAEKSIVLLKNENNLLPLEKQSQKIGLIGPLAKDKTSPLGSWRLAAEEETAVSVWEGFSNYPAENQLSYANGVRLLDEENPSFVHTIAVNETDRTGISEAVQLAKNVDVVVMVIGEHGLQSGEGRSRTRLDLPGLQQELLEEVYKANKNIVVVLQNGRPLDLTWMDAHIPAIVEAWHLGTESGNAITSVLYGDYNPSGKLPMSFPKNIGQLPLYYNKMSTGRPIKRGNEVFWSHYNDESNEALYPFGFGLSYTTFEISAPKLITPFSENRKLTYQVNITNTGTLAGKETLQLYIRQLHAKASRPIKELKGFEQVNLEPGETKEVTFILTEKELGYYLPSGEWNIEEGASFEVFVGSDSTTQNKTSFSL